MLWKRASDSPAPQGGSPSGRPGSRGVRTCQSDRSDAFRVWRPLDSTPAPGQYGRVRCRAAKRVRSDPAKGRIISRRNRRQTVAPIPPRIVRLVALVRVLTPTDDGRRRPASPQAVRVFAFQGPRPDCRCRESTCRNLARTESELRPEVYSGAAAISSMPGIRNGQATAFPGSGKNHYRLDHHASAAASCGWLQLAEQPARCRREGYRIRQAEDYGAGNARHQQVALAARPELLQGRASPARDPPVDRGIPRGWLEQAGELCALDTDIAARLGMARPTSIRSLIEANRAELEAFGPLHAARAMSEGSGAQRAVTALYLNEEQALLISAITATLHPQATKSCAAASLLQRCSLCRQAHSTLGPIFRSGFLLHCGVGRIVARNCDATGKCLLRSRPIAGMRGCMARASQDLGLHMIVSHYLSPSTSVLTADQSTFSISSR